MQRGYVMKEEKSTAMQHIADVMNRHPVIVSPDADLSEVLDLFEGRQVDGAAVVDADDKLLGFISPQDCLHSLLQSSFYCGEMPRVKEVMSASFASVAPTESLLALAQAMEKSAVTTYLVIDRHKVVGSISRAEVIQLLRKELGDCSRAAHA